MWALLNRTAFAASRNWTRDRTGAHWWVVAVKATYRIDAAGRLVLAEEQPPPLLAPETGADGQSLRVDSDLLAVKATTDINVVAHAHAPNGRPATVVHVALRAGPIDKQLVVHGERVYTDGVAGAAQPFQRRELGYALAFGGSDLGDPNPRHHRVDERNPVGRGFAVRAASLQGKPAHAIEYPSGDPARRGPAGFGPIAPGWLPRRALAGTYDARWERTKKPLLPDDYQPDFAQSSPVDQRPERPLVGGERVELRNLSPEGLLRFELPRVALRFTTHIGEARQRSPQVLTGLILEPELRRVALVWQTAVRVVAADADYLDATEIVEERPGR